MATPLGLELALMIEQTITIGNIIEIFVIGAGGIGVFFTMKTTVSNIKSEVAGMQVEIKKLSEILIGMARFDEKLTNLDRRVTAQGRRIDELSHGEGFVRGLRSSVDGEYP